MYKAVWFAIGIPFLLAACGASEPSDIEMKEAFMQMARSISGATGERMYGDAKLKKISCAKVDKAFKCDFELGGLPLSGRFIKSDEGWRYFPV